MAKPTPLAQLIAEAEAKQYTPDFRRMTILVESGEL